jgi:hypothetical protein
MRAHHSSLLYVPQFTGNPLQQNRGYGVTQDIYQRHTTTQTSADISISTAEGDTVTLSASALFETAYIRYDARGRLKGQQMSVHADSLQQQQTSEFALVIEGDLSEEELLEVQAVLQTLQGIATDFFARDLDEALGQAQQLGDFDSLSSIAATFQYAHTDTANQLSTQEQGMQTRPPLLSDTKHLQRLMDRMKNAIEHGKMDKEKMVSVLSKPLSHLWKKLAEQHQVGGTKHKDLEQLTNKVLQNLQSSEAPAQSLFTP